MTFRYRRYAPPASRAQEHIQDALFRQSRHDHVVQRSGSRNAVHTHIPGQTHGIDQQQEGSCCQSRIEDVLTQTAAEALHHNDGEGTAQSCLPVRHSMGQGHGQQNAGDHGRTVHDGVSALGQLAVQPLRSDGRTDADGGNEDHPEAELPQAHCQCRQQCQNHIQHDAVGAEITADMRRRSNSQFHFALASLTICLPFRNRSTRGSLPGQVNAQLPHSMQSRIFRRFSSSTLPALVNRYM